jgi:Leucine-rich repeat (LRR) protein
MVNYTSLVDFEASYNQLTGSIPDLHHLKNLDLLNLDHNQLTGTIPEWIGGPTKLQQLTLNNNNLSGSIPASIGNLTTTTFLGG